MTYAKRIASKADRSAAKLALVGPLLGLLAACGGGAQTAGMTVDPEPVASDPDTVAGDPDPVISAADALFADYFDANGDLLSGITPMTHSEIPSIEGATYSGFIKGQLDGDDLTARLSIDVNFVTDGLTTTADQFVLGTDDAMTGSLTGTDEINRDGSSPLPQIAATISGDLDGNSSTLSLDGNFLVQGTSTNITAIGGQVEGNIGTDFLSDGIFAGD